MRRSSDTHFAARRHEGGGVGGGGGHEGEGGGGAMRIGGGQQGGEGGGTMRMGGGHKVEGGGGGDKGLRHAGQLFAALFLGVRGDLPGNPLGNVRWTCGLPVVDVCHCSRRAGGNHSHSTPFGIMGSLLARAKGSPLAKLAKVLVKA